MSPVRASALADSNLLRDVVAFKQRFYPSAWARYDLAVPGGLKLLPATPSHLENLAHDRPDVLVVVDEEDGRHGRILIHARDPRYRRMEKIYVGRSGQPFVGFADNATGGT